MDEATIKFRALALLGDALKIDTVEIEGTKHHTLTLDPTKVPGDGHFHATFQETAGGGLKLVDYVAEVR